MSKQATESGKNATITGLSDLDTLPESDADRPSEAAKPEPVPVRPSIDVLVCMGATIRHYRNKAGISQADMSASIGVSQPTYSRFEATGDITLSKQFEISRRIGMAPDQISVKFWKLANILSKSGYNVVEDGTGTAILSASYVKELLDE